MTLNGAITQLVLLSEHPMMPVIFRPALQKVIETISEFEAQPEQDWIPVSVRMPKEREWVGTKRFGTTISDEVYVTFETHNGERFTEHISFQNGKVPSFKQREIDVCHGSAVPIAWKPQPEPWKGDTE